MTAERQELSAEELESQLITELPNREAMTLITTTGTPDFLGIAPDATPIPPGDALPGAEPVPPSDALPDSEPLPPGDSLPDGDGK